MKSLRITATSLATALVIASGAALGMSQGPEELTFSVLLDDRPIGEHRFRIEDNADSRVVESVASFDVSVLFVSLFSYRHSNTEVWRDGCLARIESETDSNGDRYKVDGRQEGQAFALKTAEGARSYAADCLMTFAYWDRRFLDQERLLNAQTGEVVAVDVQPLGSERLTIAGIEVPTEAFRIRTLGEGLDIKVSYDERTGRWVALESRLANGKLMRYLPAADERLAMTENRRQSVPGER
ncbi:MAG: DUF6134 family protein [Sedimenticolaceae bacterium]